MPVLTKGSVLDCFYLLIFYSEKFSTGVWRLPFTVNVNLNLSILHWYVCGMDGRTVGRAEGRAVTWLPKFLRCIGYQIFLPTVLRFKIKVVLVDRQIIIR